MAPLPQREHGTPQAIYALHARQAAAEPERAYLGWSQIGDECDRALWYGFRWVGRKVLDGRMARLFGSGDIEEARVLRELRELGYEVHDRDADGRQFGVSSVGGHLRGHADAVVRGLPEAPKTWHLTDVKTAKAKKFDELLKKGFRALYPKYHAQGQGYMGHLELERAAFIFVCKDDDRIHVERFEFDRAEFERLEKRAHRIITSASPMLGASDVAAAPPCLFCDFKAVCHEGQVPAVNCRTCAHATPVLDGDAGAWRCDRFDRLLTVDEQRAGCDAHLFIPPLLAAIGEPIDGDVDRVVYQAKAGGTFTNGAGGFKSIEIRAAEDRRALTDPTVQAIKAAVPTAELVR